MDDIMALADNKKLIEYIDRLSAEVEADTLNAFEAMWCVVGYITAIVIEK